MAVGHTDSVARRLRKLQFNVVVSVIPFMQNCGSKSAKPMSGHSPFIAHALKSFEDCVVARGLERVPITLKKQFAVTGDFLQSPEQFNCLLSQQHNVRDSHFHAIRWDVPTIRLDMEFYPLGSNQLARSDEGTPRKKEDTRESTPARHWLRPYPIGR